jgi:hypothetical protein
MKHWPILFIAAVIGFMGCGKNSSTAPPVIPKPVTIQSVSLDNASFSNLIYGSKPQPVIRVSFNEPVLQSSIPSAVTVTDASGNKITLTFTSQANDSVLLAKPAAPLSYLSKYTFKVSSSLQSASGGSLVSGIDQSFITQIDSSRKFPALSDNSLLDIVQQQTLKYFWDFGHPVSGLARERNTSGDLVTSGGSGFGIMAILVGINRGFITKPQGLSRIQTIVAFLKNTAQTFHGAFPHWLNGVTGAVIPFSTKDDGADLVETSYLVQGLLCARQYFNDAGVTETNLRNDINSICNKVEWSCLRQNNQNVLYWHWSSTYQWDINMPIRGWNEALITYVLAASSTTYGIPSAVYSNGWANNPGFINGNIYYSYQLPLGPALGGPSFFEHYSFLGINPNGLNDAYANYATQTKNHTLINYTYCRINPKMYFGYSDSVWGLTASDIPNGYAASSPTNDLSVIAPTAALSSFPYTPAESMAALKFYYYVLGDKLWKEYGFVDAFSLKELWFANSFLAIDQGPIIVMIENYRSGLLWNLFTSCPEVKAGMTSLGFTAPYL